MDESLVNFQEYMPRWIKLTTHMPEKEQWRLLIGHDIKIDFVAIQSVRRNRAQTSFDAADIERATKATAALQQIWDKRSEDQQRALAAYGDRLYEQQRGRGKKQAVEEVTCPSCNHRFPYGGPQMGLG